MTTYAHFALSYPAAYREGTNPFGWSPDFAGDWDRLGQTVRTVCGKLGLKSILLRGYDGCRFPRWEIGRKDDSKPVTSGVLRAGLLSPEMLVARRGMIRGLLDDGYEIMVHTGPATNEHGAHAAARVIADDGVQQVAIDSSGMVEEGHCHHQLETLEHFGVKAYIEPTGADRPALANVRFIVRKIAAGQLVTDDVAWLNDPTEEQRADPEAALAECVAAGASTAVPYPLLAKMRGVAL